MPESLLSLATTFLAAGEKRAAFSRLTTQLKSAIQASRIEDAATALRHSIHPDLDFTSALALIRIRRSLREWNVSPASVRIAVLSNHTVDHLIALADLFLFSLGLDAEFYTAPYGTLRQEILDPVSGLYQFQPQVTFLATSWRDLGHVPQLGEGMDRVHSRLQSELNDRAGMWQRIIERTGGQVLQNNFEVPPARTLDNHERRHPAGLAAYIDRLNLGLVERAPLAVTIHDLDHLSANVGRWTWGDERFFHMAKLPCAPECQVAYAHSVASVLAALRGVTRKCLVLDLDNTLWGGVIGDDGLGGIRLGQGDAEGEAFLAFQRFAKALKDRGVLLAVCSKNNERTGREVFEQHPEMVLRLDDIACFVANWDDKATNLKRIAQHLNIGVNSLVFVDDNPAERALVREVLPDVAVPEMPADPAEFVRALEKHRYFQIVNLASEDLQRTEFYRANAERAVLETATTDMESYLRSLHMTARIGPVTATNVERSAQLVNKSNQFNLTTRRTTSAELLAKAGDRQWVTMTVSLADRFGDNGLISVILARRDADALAIETWLMSCRVLKRGVEAQVLNELAASARAAGLKRLVGEYIPTPKNSLVADHYSHLGFSKTSDIDGVTSWELKLENWKPLSTNIEVLPVDGQAA